MRLESGTKLGTYEIIAAIGKGGMGEVYRASDRKLGREVAVKVLPSRVAEDPDTMARFEREARLLASLNHPHIATLHGLEESEGVTFLVMELIEGQTLAERIAVGPLPLVEVLRLFEQTAEALEAAHDKGIVHRDLKPGNIKITRDGKAKVLDFGLAKPLEPQGEKESPESPTLTRNRTGSNLILGTPAYMSPEQARGEAVDERADIWSFGCCLYEALSRRPPFTGATPSDTLAAVLEREPDFDCLPSSVPGGVRALLRRTLRKDRSVRLHHIADARIELAEARAERSSESQTKPRRARSGRESVAWVAAALALAVAGAFGLGLLGPVPEETDLVHFSFDSPGRVDGLPALSPTGRQIVFSAAGPAGHRLLWVRALEGSSPTPLEGTEGARYPFWAPDGNSIAFFAGERLKRIPSKGGPLQSLCDARLGRGGTWNRLGDIVLQPTNRDGLYRVPASGGALTPVTKLNASLAENSHRDPCFLPDGRHFLFTARAAAPENTAIYVGSLDGPAPRRLITAQSNGVYAPPGYILFAREGALFAQPFDARRLELTGDAVPVAQGVRQELPSAYAHFTVSRDGRHLAYQSAAGTERQLVWFDRAGERVGEVPQTAQFEQVRISRDGRQVALTLPDSRTGNRDIWLMDLARGLPARFTVGEANDWYPAFSPDDGRMAFASDRDGVSNVYTKSVRDAGSEELQVLASKEHQWPLDWYGDGGIVYQRLPTGGLWMLSATAGEQWTTAPLATSDFLFFHARVSPDRRFVAYASGESGRAEVYVRPIGTGNAREAVTLVSSEGGMHPRWSADGTELFYLDLNGTLNVARLEFGTKVTASRPTPLFESCAVDIYLGDAGQPYDVAGKRFLFICPTRAETSEPIDVVLNWQKSMEEEARSFP